MFFWLTGMFISLGFTWHPKGWWSPDSLNNSQYTHAVEQLGSSYTWHRCPEKIEMCWFQQIVLQQLGTETLCFCHYYGFWYDERGCLDIAFLQFLELLARSLFFFLKGNWYEMIKQLVLSLVGLCRCNMYTVYVLKGFNPFYNESNHYETLNFGWFVCWLDFFPTCFYIPQKHNFGWHYSFIFWRLLGPVSLCLWQFIFRQTISSDNWWPMYLETHFTSLLKIPFLAYRIGNQHRHCINTSRWTCLITKYNELASTVDL